MEYHFHPGARGARYDDLPFPVRNSLEWAEVQRQLFPVSVPTHAVWDRFDQIIDVLNTVGKLPNLNHMLLPWHGGLDLSGAKSSRHEPGCLELTTPGSMCLVKPARLRFESFNSGPEWNYFWLETGGLPPSGLDSSDGMYESVTDVGGYLYADWSCWDDNRYDGEPLPRNSQRVFRCLHESSFLILQKTSLYNRNPQTYSGQHNNMGADAFRGFIETLVAESAKSGMARARN